MTLTSYERAGLRFDLDDRGPRDGDPVVLLHGFPQHRGSWSEVAPALVERGHRVLAPDLRGYSPEARPLARRAYRAVELVDDVLALFDAAGLERAHLVGHDWGGALAWSIAAAAPERLERLTVVSTPHPAALRHALPRSLQALQSAYIGFFQVPRVPEAVLTRTLRSTLTTMGLPDDRAREYQRKMWSRGALRAALNWYRGYWLPGARSLPPSQPITVPTAYVWGRHDPALGRRAAENTRRFVAAPYRFTELDAGHWIPELAAERLVEEVIRPL